MKSGFRTGLFALVVASLINACGGGSSTAAISPPPPPPPPPPIDTDLDWDQGNWDEENWQ